LSNAFGWIERQNMQWQEVIDAIQIVPHDAGRNSSVHIELIILTVSRLFNDLAIPYILNIPWAYEFHLSQRYFKISTHLFECSLNRG